MIFYIIGAETTMLFGTETTVIWGRIDWSRTGIGAASTCFCATRLKLQERQSCVRWHVQNTVIGSCKSNYHMITATTTPKYMNLQSSYNCNRVKGVLNMHVNVSFWKMSIFKPLLAILAFYRSNFTSQWMWSSVDVRV
jgi:hypothetical protein